MRQNLLAVAAATLFLTACNATSDALLPKTSHQPEKPKNVIMIVSDGMGPAYTTAYRNFRDDPATPQVESVIFDRIFVGNASTYPAQESGFVTDSAAAVGDFASATAPMSTAMVAAPAATAAFKNVRTWKLA